MADALPRAVCMACRQPATGVVRSISDGFIYDAACDLHGKTTATLRFDRWGDVYGPAGPVQASGVYYVSDPLTPKIEYLP